MDAFLEACGATGPLRLEIKGPRLGRRRRTIARPYALVGRSSSADIRLGNPQISLRHAYFQLVQGRLACFDLGGRGGLRWDNDQPSRSGWLDPGGTVHIGPYEVRRLDGDVDVLETEPFDTTPPLNLRWNGPGETVTLIFPDEIGGPVRWRMTRAVTLVGRAPSCRVRLPDESVSWFHCALVRTPAGAWLVDLLSRGGVTVNGIGRRYVRLDEGDELMVGRFRVAIRYGDLAGSSHPVHEHSPQTALHAAFPGAPALPAEAISALAQQAAPALPQVDLPLEPELLNLLSASGVDSNSPAMVALVEQFGRMQQQMLEQFYQSTMALIGHLDDHYRDQMRQMREEMDRLRELSQELVGLREQLAQIPPTVQVHAGSAQPALAPPPNGHTPPPSFRPPLPPIPAVSQGPFPAPKPMAPTAADPEIPRPKPGPIPRPAAGADDPLVLVSRRIAEIRGEQRSRWRKILDLVRVR